MPLNAYPDAMHDALDAAYADRAAPFWAHGSSAPTFRRPSEPEPDPRCAHQKAAQAPWCDRGRCGDCAAEERAAWAEGVSLRLRDALSLATVGRAVRWRVWPTADEQTIVDEAADEFGFTPWTVRHDAHDPAQDGVRTRAESEAFMAALIGELYDNPLHPKVIQGDWTGGTVTGNVHAVLALMSATAPR